MSRRRRRQMIAAGVLAVWMAVLAWHVRREYFRPLNVRLAEASSNLTPMASFYSIRMGESPMGFASSSLDTLPDGFLLRDEMRLRVRALGADAPANVRTRVRLSERLELQMFDFALRSDLGEFRVDGKMRGDSALDLTVFTSGEEQKLTLETGGPVLLSQIMLLHLAVGVKPEVGREYTFEIFDPSTLDRQRVTLEVRAQETLIVPDSAEYVEALGRWRPATYDTVSSWRVVQDFNGVEVESWIDPDGQVVRARSPLGYTIERTAFEIAWNEWQALQNAPTTDPGGSPPDVIEQTALSVGVDLPRGRQLRRLAVRLQNVDLAGFDLDGARQLLRGDTLFVEAGSEPRDAGYLLPASEEEWGEVLSSTPLIQADDPEIRSLAREVTGATTDPVVAARRLTEWVYEALDKQITFSVPSARQVLDARRGDCNEHTVLYVAMARAIGLPARTAAGLVRVRGRFYYHAWPEVWLGEWVPVDPTLDQHPADASHLRFVLGELARQIQLVRLIGRLQLDVVDVEAR